MRNVFEVTGPGPGVQLVCNVGPGPGVEPVRIVPEARGAQLVRFMPTTGPGVVPVNVVEGLPAAEQAYVQAQTAPPDTDDLTEVEHAILGDMTEKWQAVQATRGGDADDLFVCAEGAVAGLRHPWQQSYWVESLMMMGSNSAVMLWGKHRDPRAVTVLKALADEVLKRRWLQGGPAGLFEAHEAQNVMGAFGEAERAAQPQAPAAAPEPAKKKRWFGR